MYTNIRIRKTKNNAFKIPQIKIKAFRDKIKNNPSMNFRNKSLKSPKIRKKQLLNLLDLNLNPMAFS